MPSLVVRLLPYLLAVAAAFGAYYYAWDQGADSVRAECKAAELQGQLDAAKKALELARNQHKIELDSRAMLDEKLAEGADYVRKLEDEVAKAPREVLVPVAGLCPDSHLDRATDADIKRLRVAPSKK